LLSRILFSVFFVLELCRTAVADGPPFSVAAGLFDQARADDLGLDTAEGTETVTVFSPSDTTDHYGNGVFMTGFKGWLYCQWQSSSDDEDSPDTWVAYSRSRDGTDWTAPMILAPGLDEGYRSSGGWWVAGDTLVAYINVWPSSVTPRGGYTEYLTSIDGIQWSEPKSLPMADGAPLEGIFEQDPHALPDGRIIGAAHFQPGLLVAPIYTDDPSGVRGWTRAHLPNLDYSGANTREMEPSWFLRSDGAVVMVFRDQNSTFCRLASVSFDRGENWSTPVLTDMPDSRSKQSAGNLPDGTAFQVGNPVDSKVRIPLVVSVSKEGQLFDKAFVLRRGGNNLQAQRYTGTSKTIGYSYPKSMVWEGRLYVSYATNKEDVEYTSVPLTSLSMNGTSAGHRSGEVAESGMLKIIPGLDGINIISLQGCKGECSIQIYSPTGKLLFSGTKRRGENFFPLRYNYAGASIAVVTTHTYRKTVLFCSGMK
jgi:hypothetical protein